MQIFSRELMDLADTMLQTPSSEEVLLVEDNDEIQGEADYRC